MQITEILLEFEKATGRFARAAVEAAAERREEITPGLLRILESTVDRAPQLDAEGDYMAHLYAMFLLAQFRETRAYPLVSASRRFRATSWIHSAATSSQMTSGGCSRPCVAATWRASGP